VDTDVKGVVGQGKVDLVRFDDCASALFLEGETFSKFSRSNSLQMEIIKNFQHSLETCIFTE
jgi:hypothetical protein